ncbi:hypothetical protein HY485_01120 [Candidatus Woesearchaeota archaeon]|nr:hypothetical protein [Candidatus Woesearchaeota archaeon]
MATNWLDYFKERMELRGYTVKTSDAGSLPPERIPRREAVNEVESDKIMYSKESSAYIKTKKGSALLAVTYDISENAPTLEQGVEESHSITFGFSSGSYRHEGFIEIFGDNAYIRCWDKLKKGEHPATVLLSNGIFEGDNPKLTERKARNAGRTIDALINAFDKTAKKIQQSKVR